MNEMEQVIDEYITLGYAVERGQETALLKKSGLLRTVDQVLLKIDYTQDTKSQMLNTSRLQDIYDSARTSSIADAQHYRPFRSYSSRTADRSLSLSRFNQVDLLIILVALVWGMIAGVVIALPLELILNVPAGLAALIEEPAKILPLIGIAVWYPYLLYSKKKCAVFGAAAGLGFGVLENFLYFARVPGEYFDVTVVGRTVFLPTHMIYSAIAAMSLMYIVSHRQRYYTVILFLLPVFFHIVWNSVIPAVGIYVATYIIIIVLFVLIYRIVPNQVVDPNATPTSLDELFHHPGIS